MGKWQGGLFPQFINRPLGNVHIKSAIYSLKSAFYSKRVAVLLAFDIIFSIMVCGHPDGFVGDDGGCEPQ